MSSTVARILIGQFRVNDSILQTLDVKEDDRGQVEKWNLGNSSVL